MRKYRLLMVALLAAIVPPMTVAGCGSNITDSLRQDSHVVGTPEIDWPSMAAKFGLQLRGSTTVRTTVYVVIPPVSPQNQGGSIYANSSITINSTGRNPYALVSWSFYSLPAWYPFPPGSPELPLHIEAEVRGESGSSEVEVWKFIAGQDPEPLFGASGRAPFPPTY